MKHALLIPLCLALLLAGCPGPNSSSQTSESRQWTCPRGHTVSADFSKCEACAAEDIVSDTNDSIYQKRSEAAADVNKTLQGE